MAGQVACAWYWPYDGRDQEHFFLLGEGNPGWRWDVGGLYSMMREVSSAGKMPRHEPRDETETTLLQTKHQLDKPKPKPKSKFKFKPNRATGRING